MSDSKEEKEENEIILNETLAKNEYPANELKLCNSLMAKYLTKDLFDKLKDGQTKNGFMLKNAINTGVKNPQSLVGIHAGDIESYSLFNDIFGAVIRDYHQTKTYHSGIKSSFSADCDEKWLEIEEGDIAHFKNIKSTRIRVARNIDGFPLAPSQRSVDIKLEIEEIMKKVFDSLQYDNELKGEYYALHGMEEEIRQKLVDDHLLFSGNDDPMQTDSGYHLWFPRGRGIYLNEAKTFIVWLNEGDHLRLISMQKSNNVKAVFNRLKKAVSAIEKGIKLVTNGKHNGFLFDAQYGNVTCCPTNLGTGLRSSVHISLPRLCQKGLDKLNDIGIKYKMQIRGLYGEHSEIEENCIVDISNKFRMGYSERTLVQFMCDGVNALNKMEIDLVNNDIALFNIGDRVQIFGLKAEQKYNGSLADVAGPYLIDTKRWPVQLKESSDKLSIKGYNLHKIESLESLFTKLEQSNSTSLLKKYLTRQTFETLKGKQTKQGRDLRSCVMSGMDNMRSAKIGVYASDADAYAVFADLFNPIISDYHKLPSLQGFKHPKQNFKFDDAFPADLDPEGTFIISTRVRVARNVEGYPLRGGMNETQTMELEEKIKGILEEFKDDDLKGKYYPLSNMNEATRKQLVADHFLFKKGDEFLESAGINRFWPNGRGIFFNNSKTFLVWLNEEDQLRIISMEQGANIKSVFGRLEKAVAAINNKLQFAYHKQLGYLTACPTNIGCGERASVHIRIPLTSRKKQLFDAIAKRNNLQIRGVDGENSESKGGVFDVSNKRRLGITEWDGVKDLINGCNELIQSEIKLQSGYDVKEEKEENEIIKHTKN